MKKALITGITGQDGSYLAEFLLSKDYEVHGIVRPAATPNTSRINHILPKLKIHRGDLADSNSIISVIKDVKPDEVYNLAAQSNVGISIDMPEYSSDITALGTTRLLEIIRHYSPDSKFYQASSSEMFGEAMAPQNEDTPFRPLSPYACSKLYAYWMTINYRDAYNLFGVNGVLFNHESARRGEIFVTRKITMAIANILAGKQDILILGALNAYRDWGFAPEYVECMWKMLQQDKPDDYAIGIGETHTVRDFLFVAFKYAGLDVSEHVSIEMNQFGSRGAKVLKADTAKAQRILGWNPRIKFEKLVKIMVDADIRALAKQYKHSWDGDAIIRDLFPDKWWEGD